MWRKKAPYLTNFGIVPHFLSLLTDCVKDLKDGYVLLFNESLNKNQKKQLDAHLFFWDADNVSSCYFGTEFMGHATEDDLLRDLDHITEGLPIIITNVFIDIGFVLLFDESLNKKNQKRQLGMEYFKCPWMVHL